MKAYYYQRVEGGVKAKEWSYRLRNIPRDLPKSAWPDKFKKNGTLWTSKARTVEYVESKVAEILKAGHDIKMGRRPAAVSSIRDAKAAYVEWGRVQGGARNEMGWAEEHVRHVDRYLEIWIEKLKLESPMDLMDAQPVFRRALVRMLHDGLAPNTVNHRAQTLTGFCRWMVEEKLLPTNPLAHKTLDRTPRAERGKFRLGEVAAIISVAPMARAVVYHLAFVTGYRKTSISKIRAGFIDWATLTIGLNHLAVKNRRKTVKPLPPRLAEALWPLCQGKVPGAFIFDWFKPKKAVKLLRRDMKAAGVPVKDDQGRVRDFHSLKVSYGAAMDDLGTEPKVMQKGLDHATFTQTLAYLKRELEPVREAAELVEAGLFPATGRNPEGHAGVTDATAREEIHGESTGYGAGGWNPSPSAPTLAESRNGRASARNGETPRIAAFPNLPQASLKDAQRIVSRLYHRFTEPGFLRAVDLLVQASPAQAAQIADLLKTNQGRKAAG